MSTCPTGLKCRPKAKRLFSFPFRALCLFAALAFLIPMTGALQGAPAFAQGEKVKVAAASYPVFLFARWLNSGRGFFDVQLLTSPGTGCPHEFNPRPNDLERLRQTPILVKNGLNLEIYLDRAINVAKPDIFVIDASAGVPTLPNNRERVKVTGDPSATNDLPNPHIFFSVKNAPLMAANIAKGLSEKDPEGAPHYQERLKLFQDSMAGLQKAVDAFKSTRSGYKVVASHNFIDYFTDELGISVVADIEPEPDVTPSPARLSDIIRVIREQKVAAILLEPEADFSQGRTLQDETGAKAAVVDPATAGPAEPPDDYFQQVLKKDIEQLSQMLPANAGAQAQPAAQGPPAAQSPPPAQ